MCASCGCEALNDDHADPRNITLVQVKEAAEAAKIALAEAGDNIADAAAEAANKEPAVAEVETRQAQAS